MLDLDDYEWLVAMTVVWAFAAAFWIGANDVPNAWSVPVASGALTHTQAVFLAILCESSGAILAGLPVATTMAKGIADVECFQGGVLDAALLISGEHWAVITVWIWLMVATTQLMPVSTTHTAVMAVVGMAVSIKGTGCIEWYEETGASDWYFPDGLAGILIAWVISPILSGIITDLLFIAERTFILRHENSFDRAIKFYPVLVFITMWLGVFFVLAKGISKRVCFEIDDNWLCEEGKVRADTAAWLAAICAAAVAIGLLPFYRKIATWARKPTKDATLPNRSAEYAVAMTEISAANTVPAVTEPEPEPEPEPVGFVAKLRKGVRDYWNWWLALDLKELAYKDETVVNIDANAEVFDEDTEHVFRFIQIYTACFDSFAHGANDIANAMGMAIAAYVIFNTGKVSSKSDAEDDAYWILAIGALGMACGLLFKGHRMMRLMGFKVVKVTPSRGVAIEVGAAIVVTMASFRGIPVSTTHCQYGSLLFIGLLEGIGGVNWKVTGVVMAGWILTMVVSCLTSGILTAYSTRTPMVFELVENAFPNTTFTG